MSDLKALENELLVATKGCRLLDHKMQVALEGVTKCEYPPCVDGHGAGYYTTRLDDAVALVEKHLPDHHYLVNFRASRIRYAGDAEVTVSDSAIIWTGDKEYSAGKPTGNAALSLSIALIRAKQAG